MNEPTRYRLDSSVRRHGTVVTGGSPLRLFRLTVAGKDVVAQIEAGKPICASTLTERLVEAGAIHPEPVWPGFSSADVTIVVPVFGSSPDVDKDAVVVDDGSPEAIENASVRLETNQGPGAARNAGLELVATRLVAFVDSDVELADGWLDPLLAHFNDPRIALVAPRVRSTPTKGALGNYERRHSPLDMGDEGQIVRKGSRVSYVPTAAIVCRVEAIRDIGGFDPELRFGEDVDLVWRLNEAGWRCRYEPRSVVHHHPRPSWPAWIRQRIAYGRSTAPLHRKHPGAVTPIRASAVGLTSWVIGVACRPLYGASIHLASAAMLARKLPDLPTSAVFQLTSVGSFRVGQQIARAVRTTWWPLLALPALRYRTARRVLLASMLAAQNPIKAADDVAFSIGVWRGMIAERSFGALVPHISSSQISSKPSRQPSSPADAR